MGIQNAEKHPVDETLSRLVAMVYQTNLVALDKTLSAIRRMEVGYINLVAARVGSIAERIWRCQKEVGLTLPIKKKVDKESPINICDIKEI